MLHLGSVARSAGTARGLLPSHTELAQARPAMPREGVGAREPSGHFDNDAGSTHNGRPPTTGTARYGADNREQSIAGYRGEQAHAP